MIYETLARGPDGLYHVKARTDGGKRCLTQLKNVKVIENENGEIDIDVTESPDMSKVDEIHELNTSSAFENSQTWFGKQLTEDRTKKFYCKKSTITADEISATKIYDARKTTMPLVDLKIGSACTVLLEFSGLWFGKKTFGSSWNLVQARLNPEPEPEPEPEVEKIPEPEAPEENTIEVEAAEEPYPDEYMIVDED